MLIALGAGACRDNEAERQKYLHAAHMSQAPALASTAKVHVAANYEEKG